MGIDKRDHPRHPVIADVEFKSDGMPHHGRVSDLSIGGIFIDTMNPAEVGTVVHFSFLLPGTSQRIEGDGVVTWNQPMVGMGIRFNSLDTAITDAVQKYLTSL